MKTYEVVYVNVMSIEGAPERIRVESPSHGCGDLLRAVEAKKSLAPGVIQILEARAV